MQNSFELLKESRYLDYYNINLGGNNRKILIQNQSLQEGKKLALVGDSFSLSMLPMHSANFKEIHYFDARYLNLSITDYGKEIGADQVIFMFNANLASNRYDRLK